MLNIPVLTILNDYISVLLHDTRLRIRVYLFNNFKMLYQCIWYDMNTDLIYIFNKSIMLKYLLKRFGIISFSFN